MSIVYLVEGRAQRKRRRKRGRCIKRFKKAENQIFLQGLTSARVHSAAFSRQAVPWRFSWESLAPTSAMKARQIFPSAG